MDFGHSGTVIYYGNIAVVAPMRPEFLHVTAERRNVFFLFIIGREHPDGMNIAHASAIDSKHIHQFAIPFGIEINLWDNKLPNHVILKGVLGPAEFLLRLSLSHFTTPQSSMISPSILPRLRI